MPTEPEAVQRAAPDIRSVVEIAVRLGVLLLVVVWCLQIVAPFIGIVLWAVIIAIAIDRPYQALSDLLGGRRSTAATIFVLAGLMMLIVPAAILSETLVIGAKRYAGDLASGQLSIPPPPAKVASWPIVGDRVHEAWLLASQNLAAALGRLGPQLEAVSRWLLGAAGAAGVAMLQLAASVIIAGVMLARTEGRQASITRFSTRLAGERGPEFAALAQATVQSVVQGILGVAVIQAVLAGIGFMLADVPAAGLWALLVLIAAVVQLPVALVLIVPIVLVFSSASTTVAGAFTIWCVFISLIDNVLKPILFGRGTRVPTLVIFLGAIGGMLSMGIIGLFLGAVVLALGYELLIAWLAENDSTSSESASSLEPG
jgi:predicted PurR-regulated permease PerM